MVVRLKYSLLLFALSATALGADVLASSAPPGRAWAPVVPLTYPDFPVFSATNLIRDAEGRPALLVDAQRDGEATIHWAVLAWRDSAWTDSIWSNQEVGLANPQIALNSGGGSSLLSISRQSDPGGYYRLSLWPLGKEISPPETVAVATSQLGTFAFSAALTPGRRWVSRIEQPPNETFQVRTYVSDSPGVWRAVARQGSDEFNCAITALDDVTALLVYTGWTGSWWTKLEGDQWTPVKGFPRQAQAPRFVPRPSGAWWLISTDGSNVQVDGWNGADWDHLSTLEALRDPGRGFMNVGWLEPSLETTERPAIAWQEGWPVGLEWHTAAHVAWPSESGWTVGYQVPGSDGMFIGPTVAIDRDHDVWLAWSLRYSAATLWTHTYVTATTGAPRLASEGGALRIAWGLSESAPDSWWAVLRDPGTGVFEEIARVQAGPDTSLSWLDANPPVPGAVRYRIRRESVDARFVWDSEATLWGTAGVSGHGPRAGGLRLAATRNPVGARATLELMGADPGTVEILVCDVTGRQVLKTRLSVGNEVAPSIALDLGRQPQGVYLAIARDARGRTSPGLKLVRLDD